MIFDIRTATDADAAAISALLCDTITQSCVADHEGEPETIADWLSELTPEHLREHLHQGTHWLATKQNLVIGYAALDDDGELSALYIAPAHQHSGIGKHLLAAVELSARDMGLSHIMLATTLTGRGFFRAQGFIPTRPDYAEWLEKPLQQH
ncbi:GNAT family N-acetyltransferase [Deefgea rivuli]|uniref:GNAT family N-acetyltransferase n=1 Tax=Deefgea rivuli TaxID=400948 RepID=UPI00047F585D|nr:GNAT family N-acetyltransferase [Deefgea rivuli]